MTTIAIIIGCVVIVIVAKLSQRPGGFSFGGDFVDPRNRKPTPPPPVHTPRPAFGQCYTVPPCWHCCRRSPCERPQSKTPDPA